MIQGNLANNSIRNSNIGFSGNKMKNLKKAGLAFVSALMILNSGRIDSFAKSEQAVKIDIGEYSTDYFEFSQKAGMNNDKLEKAINKSDSYLDIPLVGNYLNKNNGMEKMREAVSTGENVVNGYIDEPVIQGIIGDCWLLSAVNNISYTPSGSQIIHDAINVNKNGDVDIYFKGPDKTYTVTKEELQEENESYTLLSFGDDDMLAIEIAARKYRQDLLDGKIEIDKNLPAYLYKTNTEIDPLNVGDIRQGYWLLTGITESENTTNKNEARKLFDKFEKNPEKSLLDVEFAQTKTVKDINGKKVRLDGAHGYGVKDISGDTITLVSASNSVQEIKLKVDTVLGLKLLDVIYCSLDDVK